VRLYQQEPMVVEYAVLGAGLAVTAATAALLWLAGNIYDKHAKSE
jgi:hypothetical protein